jgi:hypothetical protein
MFLRLQIIKDVVIIEYASCIAYNTLIYDIGRHKEKFFEIEISNS